MTAEDREMRATWAAFGEMCAWLGEDALARQRFADWYNGTAARLGVGKRMDAEKIVPELQRLFKLAADTLRAES